MSERELRLRRAGPRDVQSLVELVNRAYGRTDDEPGWTNESHLVQGPRIDADGLHELLDRDGSLLLVSDNDGEVTSCVHLERAGDGNVELGLFSVDPRAQGKGLGRRVLAAAEQVAREELDAERIVMYVVDVREELLAWYERRGYTRTGGTFRFELYGDQRSLAGPLAFERLEKRMP